MSDREPSAGELVEALLRRVPFFRTLDRVDIARLIGALEKTQHPAGTVIFQEGADADGLYLLESGRVEVSVRAADGERTVAVLDAPSHFGDLGLLLARRTGSVRAMTDISGWMLPRHWFDQVVHERTSLGLTIAVSLAHLIDEQSRQRVGVPAVPEVVEPVAPEAPRSARPGALRTAGALLAVALPLALWQAPPLGGLTSGGWHVSVIVLGAALAWLFQPVPDFVVALAMVTAWGIAGLAPVSLAFAGFTSPTWVLALGAVGLAAAVARCGLLFRLTLLLMKIAPRTHAGQVCALLAGGVVTTPLVPLATARIATTSLLVQELAQSLGYIGRGSATAALAFAGLIGYTSFSSIFLTGLATNFFVLGLLPPTEHVHWLTWLKGAAPTGGILFAGSLAALLLLFRSKRAPRIAPEVVRRQERVLGPLSRHERATAAAVAALLAGLVLEPILHISVAWLGMTALIVVLAGGVLDRASFRSAIDWGFLILFGVLVGSGDVFRSVGVDRWIADQLIPIARAIGHPEATVVVLAVFVAACRLVLPRVPTNFLLSIALVPVAPRLGLAPWLVGFVVLTVGNTWLLPGLSDFYSLTRDTTKGEMFTDRDGLIAGAALTLVVLAAIAASVPYWRAIGLLAY